MSKDKRGTSVFWSASKKRYLLAYASPTGWTQKAIPRTVTSQRAADAWAAEYLAAAGAAPAAALDQRREEGPSIAECAERWLEIRSKDPKVSPATLTNNRGHVANHILPALTGSIAALDVQAVRAWLRDLRSKVAAQTCRNVYYTASTLYADAMVEGWVKTTANPFSHPGAVRELPELPDGDVVVLAVAVVQVLLDAAAVVPLERRARYAVAFTSGMRDGEIAGLRVGDFELDATTPLLRVERATALVGRTGWATDNALKTRGSKRTLPLHPAGLAAVREWLAYGWALLVGREPRADDYLFPNDKGGPSRPRSAELLRDDLAACGLPTVIGAAAVEFKVTRSSFATWLADAGVDAALRKRLMGHTSKDITEKHYTSRTLATLADAVALIPLAWISGTVPIVVPPGTANEAKSSKSLAPPARIGLATFGLGSRRDLGTDCACDGLLSAVGRVETAPCNGLECHSGLLDDASMAPGTAPPVLANMADGLANMRAASPWSWLEAIEAADG